MNHRPNPYLIVVQAVCFLIGLATLGLGLGLFPVTLVCAGIFLFIWWSDQRQQP